MEDKTYSILSRFTKIIADGGNNDHAIRALGRSRNLDTFIHVDGDGQKRILLRGAGEVNRSTYNFNGIIVSKGGILVYPPRQLKRIELRALGDLRSFDFSKYAITDAANGTMLTLYCWDNQWCLSTTRGVYVNDYAIVGANSLMYLFERLIERYGLTFSSFDPNVSYTFIMCHPDYHILPIEALYFVQAFSLAEQNVIACPAFLMGLRQPATEFKDCGNSAIARASFMSQKCMSATDRFMRGDFDRISGFIMRSRSPGGYDYYVESDITQFLHRFMYQSLRTVNIEARHRQLHFMLHVYLNAGQNSHLYDLIKGRYSGDFAAIDESFTAVQGKYEQYIERGQMPLISEFERLFGALHRDAVAPAAIRDPKYFELYFNLFKHGN